MGAAEAITAAATAATGNKAGRKTDPPVAAVKVNPLTLIYPPDRVVFRQNIKLSDKPWKNGTTSTTLADALIRFGDTRYFIGGARMVKLEVPNQEAAIDVQMPSSGQAFRRPMLDVEEGSINDDTDFCAWKKLIVAEYIKWRREAVKNGAASIRGVAPRQGVTADDELLKELGLI